MSFNTAKQNLKRQDKILKESVACYNSDKRQLKSAEIKSNLFYQYPNEMEVGKVYNDSFFGFVTVMKINKSTVTIVTKSGHAEPRKPTMIYRLQPVQ